MVRREPVLAPQPHGDGELVTAFAEASRLDSGDVGEQRLSDLGHRQSQLRDALAIEHQSLLGPALAAADPHIGNARDRLHAAAHLLLHLTTPDLQPLKRHHAEAERREGEVAKFLVSTGFARHVNHATGAPDAQEIQVGCSTIFRS